jgi:RHS repeat-associated protein
MSITTGGNQTVPFTFSTSADTLTITLTEPVSTELMRLVVFGVEGDGTVIAERIERSFTSTTEGQLDSGGAIVPISVIVENSAINNTYLFQGREWEPELGLYYYRARYYDPSLGRFLQHDPQQYADSPNLYQAFLNNPANYTDPYGTWTCEPGQECIGPSGTYGIVNIWGIQDVDSEDTSQCFVGRTPGQAYGCIVNSLPDEMSDAEKKTIALDLIERNYPNRKRASKNDLAATKGVLLPEKAVEYMGHGLESFFVMVAPGTVIAEFAPATTLGLKAKGLLKPPRSVPHGNSLRAKGPHDVYAIVDANTGQVYHFGETGRGWQVRGREWQRLLAKEHGLETEIVPLRTGLPGKAAAKQLETQYIETYEKIYKTKPFYVTKDDHVILIQKSKH